MRGAGFSAGPLVARRAVMQAIACLGIPGARLFPIGEGKPAVPISELFADAAPVRFIGTLYLRQQPDEADGRRLCRALFGGPLPRTAAGIARSIALRRARDLKTANLVTVDGWLLARCEAQLCALVALGDPSP
ncbi:MAG TPA: hypothetical protein VN668_05695 [Stellaceae bacterium]|nr:hypothetical protein [Stellaceae bacterium]